MNCYIGVDPSFTCTGIINFIDDQFFYSQKIVSVDSKLGCRFVSEIDQQSGLFVKAMDGDDTVLLDIYSDYFLKKDAGEQILHYYKVVCASLRRLGSLCYGGQDGKGVFNSLGVGLEIPMGFHQGAGAKIDRAFTSFVIAVEESLPAYYDLFLFTPPEIKKFVCGKGNAKKELVMKDVYKRWGFETDCLDLSDAYAVVQYMRKKVEDG